MPNDQSWPPELDAPIAAPGNHRLLFENEAVRVLDTSIAPGKTTPLHTHCWPGALYILSSSDFIRRDESGVILLDSRTMKAIPAGTALWSPPLGPHTLEKHRLNRTPRPRRRAETSDLTVSECNGSSWLQPPESKTQYSGPLGPACLKTLAHKIGILIPAKPRTLPPRRH